jgi:hypothetical protein
MLSFTESAQFLCELRLSWWTDGLSLCGLTFNVCRPLLSSSGLKLKVCM